MDSQPDILVVSDGFTVKMMPKTRQHRVSDIKKLEQVELMFAMSMSRSIITAATEYTKHYSCHWVSQALQQTFDLKYFNRKILNLQRESVFLLKYTRCSR